MQIAFSRLRTFAHSHDDLPAFHAAYLVLTVLTTALLNLGVFAALIAVHMALDIVKYREVHGLTWAETLHGVVRESLLDVALLSVACVFAVYLHDSVAITAGVSGMYRAQVTLLRGFGTLLPKFTILQSTLKILAHLRVYMGATHERLGKEWSIGEQLCMFTIAICVFLLFTANRMIGLEIGVVEDILTREFFQLHL